MRVQTNAHTEPIKNRTPVETIIFPNPTSGDTTPPKANPNAPSKADAIPAFARSLSIAKVLDAETATGTQCHTQKEGSDYHSDTPPI